MTMWASILCAVAFAAIIVDNKWPTHLSKHDTDLNYIEDDRSPTNGSLKLVSHFQVASRLSLRPRRSRSGTAQPQSEQRQLIPVRAFSSCRGFLEKLSSPNHIRGNGRLFCV